MVRSACASSKITARVPLGCAGCSPETFASCTFCSFCVLCKFFVKVQSLTSVRGSVQPLAPGACARARGPQMTDHNPFFPPSMVIRHRSGSSPVSLFVFLTTNKVIRPKKRRNNAQAIPLRIIERISYYVPCCFYLVEVGL